MSCIGTSGTEIVLWFGTLSEILAYCSGRRLSDEANVVDHRKRILSTIDGLATDGIPWAPRMDLWCIAQRARGTLPERFEGMNTAEIARALNVACHSVRADYTLPREHGDLVLRGLGIDNHPDYPFRVELNTLSVESRSDDENLWTRIETSAGPVAFQLHMDREMTANGVSLPFVQDYPIQSPDDFERVAQVFEHLEVIPTPEKYATFHERIGSGGLAVASGPIAASPMHLVLHELAAMDRFFYLFADDIDGLTEFAKRLEPFFDQVLEAVLACKAEVVLWGANYDQDLTWPPFFDQHIAPWLTRVSDCLHAADKRLLTHCDGENERLLASYPRCGIDVAESVCPAPMTRCSLRTLRDGFGNGTTVWGGIPSVALLSDSMADDTFEAYLEGLFSEFGGAERLILGVSDNVPPDADLDRLVRISERTAAFGPVGAPNGATAVRAINDFA